MGIIGQTQGVNKARKPPTRPAKNINHKLVVVVVPAIAPKFRNSSITGCQRSVAAVSTVVAGAAVVCVVSVLFSVFSTGATASLLFSVLFPRSNCSLVGGRQLSSLQTINST